MVHDSPRLRPLAATLLLLLPLVPVGAAHAEAGDDAPLVEGHGYFTMEETRDLLFPGDAGPGAAPRDGAEAAAPGGDAGVEAAPGGIPPMAVMEGTFHGLRVGSAPAAAEEPSPAEDAFVPRAASLGSGSLKPATGTGVQAGLITSFQGITDNGATPPDNAGAVGPVHVVTAVNGNTGTAVLVQSRMGTPLQSWSQNSFWGGTGFTDPRVAYDPYGGRFLLAIINGADSASTRFWVAASVSSDPTAGFYIYSFSADTGGECWADYPALGFNKDWVVVTANRLRIGGVGPCSQGAYVWAIPKSQLYAGAGTVTFYGWWFNDQCDGTCWDASAPTLMPATTYSSTLSALYLVNEHSRSAGKLQIRAITGTTTPTLSGPITVTVDPAGWADTVRAPQLGSTSTLWTGWTNVQSLVYRNGGLWGTQTVGLPKAGPTHTAVQWWRLTPSGGVTQFGRIDDATWFRYFPSLSVNKNDDALIGYSRSNSANYAGAYMAWRYGTDAGGTLGVTDATLKAGEGAYNGGPGNPSPRWGDYTSTVVDPVDDHSLWTVQQYAWGTTDHWANWWGTVAFPPANDNFASATLAGSVPYTTTQPTDAATTQAGEPEACSDYSATVWFRYTPAVSGTITVDTFGSNYDTVLAAYTGSSVGSLTSLACNDDFSGLQSQISFPATAGTTYRIQAGGYIGITGKLTLRVQCSPSNCVATNQAPSTPTLSCSPNPSAPGQTVTCTFSSTDASSSGVAYNVNWGDGATQRVPTSGHVAPGTTQSAGHAYGSAGTYTISVSATDNGGVTGGTATRSQTVQTGGASLPYTQTFDGGSAPGWTLTGLWHATTCRSGSPSYSLGYNKAGCPTDFDTGSRTTGTATTPPIGVPPGATLVLAWRSWYETEWEAGADVKRTLVSSDGGVTWTQVYEDNFFQETWKQREVILTGYGGTTVQVRFLFDSVHEFDNAGEGWYIDDVTLRAGTVPSPPQSLTATAGPAPGAINLQWSAPAGNGGTPLWDYRVYRAGSCTEAFTFVGTMPSGDSTVVYTDGPLANGAFHCYLVTATNALGESAPSNKASATTWSVPSAPQSPSAAAGPGVGQIRLTWSAPADHGGPGIWGYHVYRASAASGPFEYLTGWQGTTTTYTDGGLGNGVARWYRIAAVNDVGAGPQSATVGATTFAAPGAPTSPGASATAVGQLTVTWSAPASSGGTAVTGYNVYRAASSGGPYSLLAQTGSSARSYQDGGLGNGVTRYYRVSASNTVGEGPQSGTVGATTWTAPGAPLITNAGPTGVGQLTVTWSSPASNGGTAVTGYKVYRASSPAGTFWLLGTAGTGTTAYSDSGLGPGETWYYRVSATNAVGEGPQSGTLGATTWTAPGAPLGLNAEQGTTLNTIRVAWSAPSGNGGTAVTGYTLYRSTSPTSGFVGIANLGATTLSYTDSGLSPTQVYYYRATATNAVGEGAVSNTDCARPYPDVLGC